MFTPDEIAKIQKMLERGVATKDIALEFSLSPGMLSLRLKSCGWTIGRTLRPVERVQFSHVGEVARVQFSHVGEVAHA